MNPFNLFAPATIAALFLLPQSAHAQCPHDPTVTGDVMLCPQTTGTLMTETADSYQWYKRDWGQPTATVIPGATNRTLQVDYYNGAGAYFSVDATLNSCTERSPEVLVDGWAFLPPAVMHNGTFRIGQNGESLLCDGDTMVLHLMLPYDTLITWFKDGSPIPGANIDSILVTDGGLYTVEGAPSLCPNFLQPLGLSIEVIRYNTTHPALQMATNNDIEITNALSLTNIQWYRNDTLLVGESVSTLTPAGPGIYTATATDLNGCEGESQPLHYNPSGLPQKPVFGLSIYPMPASNMLSIEHNGGDVLSARIINTTGALVWTGQIEPGKMTLAIQQWPAGIYYLILGYNGNVYSRQAISVMR